MLSSFIPAAIFEILLKHVRRPILVPLWRVQDMAESNFCDHRNQLPCRMINTYPTSQVVRSTSTPEPQLHRHSKER